MQGAAAMAAGVHEEQVAVASTGVIGVPMPMDGMIGAILAARGELAPGGDGDLWRAIATTDAFEKRVASTSRCHRGASGSAPRPRARG